MKKSLKKIMASFLIASLGLLLYVPAYGASNVEEASSEMIVLDGTEYTYEYSYGSNGEKTTTITNEDSGSVDVLSYIYDENGKATVYQNGRVIAYIDKASATLEDETQIASRSSWVYMGSDSHYVTWAQGTTVSVVADVIATACGFAGPSFIITAIGYSVLSSLASNAIGCTIHVTMYYMDLGYDLMYMYTLGLTSSTGIYYGPYTIYV